MGFFTPEPTISEQRLLELVEQQAKDLATLRAEFAEVSGEMKASREATALTEQVNNLKRQVANLEIEKSKKIEEFEKKERETLHFVGLEKRRQEFEIDQAKRETSVEVREANLSAEQERFEQQMAFHKDQIAGEVERFERITQRLFDRLPEFKFSGPPPVVPQAPALGPASDDDE